MLSKLFILAGLFQFALAAPQAASPSRTTTKPTAVTTRTSTTSCPVLCIDYVDECGQGYGGCKEQCPGQPFPTYTPTRPCSKTSSKTTVTTRTLTTSCPVLCIDYVDECGQGYGGCKEQCPGQPFPTYTPTKPCTKTSTKTTTTKSITTTSSCPTVCIDYINTCGGMWGTCVPRCPGTPLPTFKPPPCTNPTTTKTTTTTTTKSSSTTSSCPTLCVDYINSCGGLWGTCFPRCPGTPMPTYTPPPCTPRSTLATLTTPPRVTTDYVTLTRATYDYETLTRSSSAVTTANPPRSTGKIYGQCGSPYGVEIVCPEGSICFEYNQWYSQCQPVRNDILKKARA